MKPKSKFCPLKDYIQERLSYLEFPGYWKWMFGSWALFVGNRMIGLVGTNIYKNTGELSFWLRVSKKMVNPNDNYFGYVVHKKDNNGNKEKVIKHLHLFECPDHVLSNETLLKEWLEDVLNVERECQQILMAKFDKIV